MTRVDRVLEVLDAGLQTSDERGYPEFSESDGCTRCHAVRAAESDFCGPCRSFLLGDTDTDPVGVYQRMMDECANLLTELSYTTGIPTATLEATADAIALARGVSYFEAVRDLNRAILAARAAQDILQGVAVALGAWFTEFAQHPVWEQLQRAVTEIDGTGHERVQPDQGTNPFIRTCPSHGVALRGGACALCQRRTRRLTP